MLIYVIEIKCWYSSVCFLSLNSIMLPAHVKSEVEDLLRRAATENVVAACKNVFRLLTENGMMYVCKVHSKFVGVHPSNRDGFGISCQHVHSLADKIMHLGFDVDQIQPVAVEVDDSNRQAVMDFNLALVLGSNSSLAPIDCSLRFASLASSHCNQVIRGIHYSISHPEGPMTEDGVCSLRKIESKDALFGQAVREGLSWNVIAAEALRMFPSLASVVQSSCNASAQIAQHDHEAQVLRKVLNSWIIESQLLQPGHSVDFQKVRSRVMASSPNHSEAVPFMYSFVLKFCGGKAAEFLADTEWFVRESCATNIKVGASIFQALSSDVKGSIPLVHVRHALLKFAYMGNTLNKAEVMKCLNANNIQQYEALMVDVRLLVNQTVTQVVHVKHLLHILDTDLIRLLLGRKMQKKYEHPESVIHDFMLDVNSRTSDLLPLKYQSFALEPEPIQEPSKSSNDRSSNLDMKELTSDGRVADMSKDLACAGFEIGANVRRKDGVVGMISAVTADKVVLKLDGLADVTMNISAFIKDGWRQFQQKSGPEAVDPSKLFASSCLEYEAHKMKARIMIELVELSEKHEKALCNLVAFNKPRSVQVTCSFSKGALFLVPTTFRISHKQESKEAHSSDQHSLGPVMQGVQFSLLQPGQNDFVSVFWYVQVVHEVEKANVELVQWKSQGVPNLSIPCYKNIVKLQAGDCLAVYKKVDKKSKHIDLGIKSEPKELANSKKRAKKSNM